MADFIMTFILVFSDSSPQAVLAQSAWGLSQAVHNTPSTYRNLMIYQSFVSNR